MMTAPRIFFAAAEDDLFPRVIARVDPQFKVTPGDTMKLGLNMRRLHLFDAETEKALN